MARNGSSPRGDALSPKSKPPWATVFHGSSHDELMDRIITLVRSARTKSNLMAESSASPSHSKKADEVQFWKSAFQKYDLDGSGALSFDEIAHLVREDLHLGERVISDVELRDFFHHIDLNGDHSIDWNEWLDFVSQGKLKDLRPLEQVLEEVGKAVRLALRRKGWQPAEVEDYVRSIPEFSWMSSSSDAVVDLELFKRIMRKGLGITRHDCPDDDIKRTFGSLAAGSYVPVREVADFFQVTCMAKMNKEIGFGTTYPGLIGGMTGKLPFRSPRNRPGTFPSGGTVSGPTTIPFCLNGRNLPPSGRLAMGLTPVSRMRRRLRPVISCPDLVSHEADDMKLSQTALDALAAAAAAEQAATGAEDDDSDLRSPAPPPRGAMSPTSPTGRGRRSKPLFAEALNEQVSSMSAPVSPSSPTSPSALGKKDSQRPVEPQSPLEMALAAAKSVQSDVLADPFAAFKASASGLPSESASPTANRPRSPNGQSSETKRTTLANDGSYRVIVGKDALNRVEQRLLEAGVDVRGGYHRTRHLR